MKADTLKTIAKHVLILPALYEDWELSKEIKEYARTIKSTKKPSWDYCLHVLKNEYKSEGFFRIFSSPARYIASEEIKKERITRNFEKLASSKIKELVEPEITVALPEKIAVKQE